MLYSRIKVSEDILLNKETNKWLLLALIMGNSISIVPSVALGYGIAQFKFAALVGTNDAVSSYSYSHGVVTLLLIASLPMVSRLVDRFPYPNGKRYYWTFFGNVTGMMSLHAFAVATTQIQSAVAWLCILLSYFIAASAFKTAIPELISYKRLTSVSGIIGASIPLCITANLILILGVFSESSLAHKLYFMGGIQFIFAMLALRVIANRHRNMPKNEIKPRDDEGRGDYGRFILVVIAKVFISIAISGTSLLSLYYVTRFGLSESEVFKLNAAMALGVFLILFAGIGSAYLAKRTGRLKSLLSLGAFFVALGLFGYSQTSVLWVAVMSGVLIQLGLGPVNALSLSLTNHCLPSRKNYARDLGIIDAASNCGTSFIHFLAPLIISTGSQLTTTDGYEVYFLALILFILLFICILWFIEMRPFKGEINLNYARNNI